MHRIALALLLPLLPTTAHAAAIADEPDSLKNVLELNLTRTQLDEVAGGEVTEFRLYTSDDRSVIAWWREKTLYVYPLTGPGHVERSTALLDLLQQHGLVTFVTERKSKRIEGFNQVSVVKAFQIAAGVRSNAGGKGSRTE